MAEIIDMQMQQMTSLNRFLDNFKKIGKVNLTIAKINNRLELLREIWKNIRVSHQALLAQIKQAERLSFPYFKEGMYDKAEETYQSTSDYIVEYLDRLTPVSASADKRADCSREGPSSALSLNHLPPIQLPRFDGNFTEWESFRDRFIALISNNAQLSDALKLHYLRSAVKDRALECIAQLPVTDDNFQVAWNLLKSRFENKRKLISIHLNNLLALPTVQRENTCELQGLLDKLNFAMSQLNHLERSPSELWSDMLICLVTQRLDGITRKAWSLKFGDGHDLPSFDDLTTFVHNRIRALEDFKGQWQPSCKSTVGAVKTHNASCTNTPFKCSLCELSHPISSCAVFQQKSPAQRLTIVKRENRCENCLSKRHHLRDCQSKYTCRRCRQNHHTLLHDDSAHIPSVNRPLERYTSSPSCSSQPSEPITTLCSNTNKLSKSRVLLATAQIYVGSLSGRRFRVRALIDQGSEATFISERVAQQLKLPRTRAPVAISAIGGISAGTSKYAASILITPSKAATPPITASAFILPTLTAYRPPYCSDDGCLEPFKKLALADPEPQSAQRVDVLIGADIYGEIMLPDMQRASSSKILAQRTVFGWILSGPMRDSVTGARRVTSAAVIHANNCFISSDLEFDLRKFWEVEEVPQRKLATPDDEKCEAHFRQTHARDSDGRYTVRLPFRNGPPIDIGDSSIAAHRILQRLIGKLKLNSDLAREYVEFMQEYESLGHMSEISSDPLSERQQRVVVPHHPVIRDSSVTTHLRVVFNASRPTTNGLSLNQHLLTGPKLQADLAAIILLWRQYQFVLSADITKMYRQIRVDRRDRNYQQIMWSPDLSANAKTYQLNTVTYGTVSAPYLALRVLKQLVEDDGARFPLASKILTRNTYVDDVLFGSDNLDSIREMKTQLVALLQLGCFELRKWASNSKLLLAEIPPDNHGLACSKDLNPDDQLKILGISWHPRSDSFRFVHERDQREVWTKRSTLATIAKIFDPLGWITPVTILAKIFIQSLWRLKISWDESLPDQESERWKKLCSQFESLSHVQIPRWTHSTASTVQSELHGFADASTVAYAAAVYLKTVSPDGTVTSSLLIGKSKVAPVKPLTVPRLELNAALLLSRVINFVRLHLNIESHNCFCWTDSTIVLAWLNRHPSHWKPYVANRVAEIVSLTPDIKWLHVPTHDNPADCASRGIFAKEINGHPLWWTGPRWLEFPQTQWPTLNVHEPEESIPEQRCCTTHVANSLPEWDLSSRYESWPRLIRVTAYIQKFIRNCREPRARPTHEKNPPPFLTADEFDTARKFWIKSMQASLFSTEISYISKGRSLSSNSKLYSLSPFLDQDNILRVGGRLQNSQLSFLTKHPIILAPHHLVHTLISHTHIKYLHAGLQLTLNSLRQKYWILRGRSLVKACIFQCVACARERAAVPTQLMGSLPAVRVSRSARSFLHCGLDYAGPISIRASAGRGITTRKAYIALFICLATRAIHLELVGDYSTTAFLHAFSRFCARRGLPESMYSDNGTTFSGADKELRAAYRAALADPNVRSKLATDGVSWNFIPPAAPHFGGLWEAGVKSVKHHLRRLVANQKLTFEEFTTLLCRVEACLNSRPLAPLHDTLDSLEVLTPGHFTIGSAVTLSPEPSLLDLNETRLSRWQRVRQLSERFWRIWQNDYINTLQQRLKWKKVMPNISPGRLVIIRKPDLPPCKWELGKVIRCHAGSDGLNRVVTVRTANSEFKRPIAKLCLLPVESET